MFLQGLVIMVVGVGMVVGFLSLLVCILLLSAKIIPQLNHILPDDEPRARAHKTKSHKSKSHDIGSVSETEIAVAIAAVEAHQRNG